MTIGDCGTSPGIATPLNNPQGLFSVDVVDDASNATVVHFRKSGVIYAVPNGKTFNVLRICASVDTASNGQLGQLMSGTSNWTDGVSDTSGTIGTIIYQSGLANKGAWSIGVQWTYVGWGYIYTFPSAGGGGTFVYPGWDEHTAASRRSVILTGYESTP